MGLVGIVIGINLFISHHNSLRADITSENLNKPSPRTVQLVKELRANDQVETIKVDAYVSPQVPAEYAAHKLNLLSTLSELSSLSGGKIVVDVHEIENFSEEAANAEKAFGIEPREIRTIDRGARKTDEFSRALRSARGWISRHSVHRQGYSDRVRVGAVDLHGCAGERKKLGVIKTDASYSAASRCKGRAKNRNSSPN